MGEQGNDENDVEVSVNKNETVKDAVAAMDRVRQYQVARLKYYHDAVLQFDILETVSHVYTEFDGMEYELSANSLDLRLRFIPQKMTFYTLSSSCLASPNLDKYQPSSPLLSSRGKRSSPGTKRILTGPRLSRMLTQRWERGRTLRTWVT